MHLWGPPNDMRGCLTPAIGKRDLRIELSPKHALQPNGLSHAGTRRIKNEEFGGLCHSDSAFCSITLVLVKNSVDQKTINEKDGRGKKAEEKLERIDSSYAVEVPSMTFTVGEIRLNRLLSRYSLTPRLDLFPALTSFFSIFPTADFDWPDCTARLAKPAADWPLNRDRIL